MKTKLLRKVRKRFSIVHYPKGIVLWSNHYKYNLFRLYDKESSDVVTAQCGRVGEEDSRQFCSYDQIFTTPEECVRYLKSLIVPKLIDEGYRTRKMRETNTSSKKVWYNG